MDFTDRKCCEDGLGNKKRSGFPLKMGVQLILNLSVFCVFLKEEIVLQVTSVSRFLNPPPDENWRPALNMLPIESVGFTCLFKPI